MPSVPSIAHSASTAVSSPSLSAAASAPTQAIDANPFAVLLQASAPPPANGPSSQASADASLIVAAEMLATTKIFTIDREDFLTYRVRRGHRVIKIDILDSRWAQRRVRTPPATT